ncbi:MAG: hypothetical protein PUC06_03055 [Oscillospiraceae bacterium]|nr:hypothetical protein [Oscillospiraceae bacterium]
MLTESYFSTAIEFLDGEEIKEVCTSGEYYDKPSKLTKKGYLVFTNKRFMIYAEVLAKGGLFKKARLEGKCIATIPYEEITLLKRHRVGSDDSFCCAVTKSGEQIVFNIFGDVFGALAGKFNTYSGMKIPRQNSI